MPLGVLGLGLKGRVESVWSIQIFNLLSPII